MPKVNEVLGQTGLALTVVLPGAGWPEQGVAGWKVIKPTKPLGVFTGEVSVPPYP
jgi:hypothetical protein